MVRALNQFLNRGEIDLLVAVYVLGTVPENDWVVEHAIDKLKKEIVYDMRNMSHNVKFSKIIVGHEDLRKYVWKHFLQDEIGKGKTTGVIALEVGKPLGYVNSFI